MQKINLPTKITISRIVLATLLLIAIFALYFLDYFGVLSIGTLNLYIGSTYINWVYLIFLGVFLIASFSDFLDGYLARKLNLVTDLGKFLDPIADKMLISGLMIFLSVNFKSMNGHMVFPFFCVIIMVIRDLIIDGLRLMAAKKNIVIAANIFGKVKTVLQMVAIVLVLLNGFPFSLFDINIEFLHISDLFCYLATFVSVLSGIIYVKQNIGVLSDAKK